MATTSTTTTTTMSSAEGPSLTLKSSDTYGDVTGPSLLSLPYDIRHMIYTLVLQPDFPLRRWEHYMTCPGCNIDITGASISQCTSILVLNRQIYHEASPILHNIEHVITAPQKPGEEIWRHGTKSQQPRVKRTGGVTKLSQLEARRLKKIRFDVTFSEVKPPAEPDSWRGSEQFINFGGYESTYAMMVDAEVPLPPVLEESSLRHDIIEMIKVLKSSNAVQKLSVRMRRWPRWQDGKSVNTGGVLYETPECAVEKMLEVFKPLMELELDNGEHVDISAESDSRNDENLPVHEFVRLFNEARQEFLQSRQQVEEMDTDMEDGHTVGKVPITFARSKSMEEWKIASECIHCHDVFALEEELAKHLDGTHQWSS